jgi:hypothetical protein
MPGTLKAFYMYRLFYPNKILGGNQCHYPNLTDEEIET